MKPLMNTNHRDAEHRPTRRLAGIVPLFVLLAIASLLIGCGRSPDEKPGDEGPLGGQSGELAPGDERPDVVPDMPGPPATPPAPPDSGSQPAAAPADGDVSTPGAAQPAAKVAGVGVGRKGRDYGTGPVATPLAARWAAAERIAFDVQIPQAMNLYKAVNGHAPRSHEEFMRKIIEENRIDLPELPEGEVYRYDPEREQLTVVEAE